MSRPSFALLCAALITSALPSAITNAQSRNPPVKVDAYRGAMVWDGEGFGRRDVIVGGDRILGAAPPGAQITEIDATGRYIVPALGSAHEHAINPNSDNDWAYFGDGVYYLWNANSIVVPGWSDYYESPGTPEVATALGGITEPGGHPEFLYANVLTKYVYRGWTREDFLGNAFHYGRTPEEIESALDTLLAQGADLVKFMVVHSEEYELRKDDPKYEGNRGLNPANTRYLVDAARRRGLKSYAHVQTAADLRVAAEAGTDVIGHLPAYGPVEAGEVAKLTVDRALAELVARSGALVVPTYAVARQTFTRQAQAGEVSVTDRKRTLEVQGNNLRLMHEAGVPLLTGTDVSASIVDELGQWIESGGVSRDDALKEAFLTGRRMFPDKRTGCFDAGCLADFLVLEGDPRKDLTFLQRAAMFVKEGRPLVRPALEEAKAP